MSIERDQAIVIADAHLVAIKTRDRDLARAFVSGDGLDLIFSGGRRFTRIEENMTNFGMGYARFGKAIIRRSAWVSVGDAHGLIGRQHRGWNGAVERLPTQQRSEGVS